jgi:hypothetical protein
MKSNAWNEPPESQAAPETSAQTSPEVKPEPFKWSIIHGAESWTHDPDEIAALSDAPIIEGLLREREVGSVIGAAKTAKTWFSLALGLSVASGEPFLGLTVHRRKVLYLDYELKPGTFRKRMSMLARDMPEGFFYQCLRGESRLPTVDEIAALVEREGFGLVVVDSLYRTGWIDEENNNDSTPRNLAPLQDFTRRVPCSLLCVDHTAKGGGNERSAVDAARGASAKGGFWDCLLVLRPTDKGPDPEGNYAILDPVLRDWPRFENLPLVSFSWSASGCTVELAGSVERGESDATATRILETLAGAEKGLSRAAIATACNIGDGIVRRALVALVAQKRVLEFPDPSHKQRLLYRLPDMADEPCQTLPNPAA